ncbi:MAG: FHA domain-containing protein [Cyanobacteria bacterium P01_F01_bin.150]
MASEAQPNHLLILEDDKGRREFALDSSIYTIGREPKCDIRLFSHFVSRRHATLVQVADDDGEGYHYRIVDGNLRGKASVNGLIINGRKSPAQNLENGDTITFGPGTKATYYQLNKPAISTSNTDEEFDDITLIDPSLLPDGGSSSIPDGAKIAFSASNLSQSMDKASPFEEDE